MNVFVIILLSFALVDGFDFKRRCLFFKNSCVIRCPRNMHPYHTRCDKDTISQRTCRSPYTFSIGLGGNAVKNFGMTSCTITPRYCDKPTLKIDAIILQKITSDLPTVEISEEISQQYKNLLLADPYFHKRSPVDIILAGYTCGWSRCDCDNTMVLSEVTWQCMEIDKCAVVKKRKSSRRRGSRRKNHIPKNIVIDDGDLIDIGNADLEPGPLDREMEEKHGKVAAGNF